MLFKSAVNCSLILILRCQKLRKNIQLCPYIQVITYLNLIMLIDI